jgi:hypothetical protein
MRRLALACIVLIGLMAVAGPPVARAAAPAAGESGAPRRSAPRIIAPPKPRPAKPKPFRLPVAYAPPTRPKADAGQCRLSCDRSLYFCEASDDADQCGGSWTQCRAACGRPTADDR